VLNPATEYVRKFTEEIDKARVVRAGVLAKPDVAGEGEPVDAGSSVHALAKLLVQDTRTNIPVVRNGILIGAMSRDEALGILVGAD
jgi:glycine betaine/proline transport system ATP-binding protein